MQNGNGRFYRRFFLTCVTFSRTDARQSVGRLKPLEISSNSHKRKFVKREHLLSEDMTKNSSNARRMGKSAETTSGSENSKHVNQTSVGANLTKLPNGFNWRETGESVTRETSVASYRHGYRSVQIRARETSDVARMATWSSWQRLSLVIRSYRGKLSPQSCSTRSLRAEEAPRRAGIPINSTTKGATWQ